MTSAISTDIDQWTIGPLVFNAVDAVGGRWIVKPQATTGWYDGAAPRLNLQEAPRNHGAYRAPSYNAERTIVIPGQYDGPSVAAAMAARDLLTGLYANGTQMTLTVAGNGISRSATVEMGAQPKLSPFVAINFDFQLTLTANDPAKYGPTQTATTNPFSATSGLDWTGGGAGGLDWTGGSTGGLNWGTVTSSGQCALTNGGTADSWPVFTIAANGGSITNPTLTDALTGNVIGFALTMSGNDQLVITSNPLNRTVLLNGVDRMPAQTSLQWWVVPAGATDTVSLTQSAYSGTPTFTMSVAPAYW